MTSKPKWLEFIGMILILLSAWWQVFFERQMANVEQEYREFALHQKLDSLMVVLADIRSQQHPEDAVTGWDAKTSIRDWKVAKRDSHNGLKKLCEWMALITTFFFLGGSAFILAGKLREIREIGEKSSQMVSVGA